LTAVEPICRSGDKIKYFVVHVTVYKANKATVAKLQAYTKVYVMKTSTFYRGTAFNSNDKILGLDCDSRRDVGPTKTIRGVYMTQLNRLQRLAPFQPFVSCPSMCNYYSCPKPRRWLPPSKPLQAVPSYAR
jgi:hypothetical protein